MSETQTSKHEFPQDWSKLTDAELISHITYLLEHIQEYKIHQIDKNRIVIGGVIGISKDKKSVSIAYVSRVCALRNLVSGSPAFYLLNGLFDKCEQQKKGQKAEKRDKIAQISVAVFITGIFMAGTWFIAGQIHNVEKMLDDNADRINKTEKRIEQKVKELEMIKTANTKDSVQKLH